MQYHINTCNGGKNSIDKHNIIIKKWEEAGKKEEKRILSKDCFYCLPRFSFLPEAANTGLKVARTKTGKK